MTLLFWILGIMGVSIGGFTGGGALYTDHLIHSREPLPIVREYVSDDSSCTLLGFSEPSALTNAIDFMGVGGLGGNRRCWPAYLLRLNRDMKGKCSLWVFAYPSYGTKSKEPVDLDDQAREYTMQLAKNLKQCLQKAGIKKPIFLTHSSGLNIVRAYLVYVGDETNYRLVISLAGDFFGNPMLVPKLSHQGFKKSFPIMGAFISTHVAEESLPGPRAVAWNGVASDTQGKQIRIEGFANPFIDELNQYDQNWQNYICIAGLKKPEESRSNFFKYLTLTYATVWKMIFIEDIYVHTELDYGALVLKNMLVNDVALFEDNDGVTPLASALAVGYNVRERKVFLGYDHDDLTTLSRDPEDRLYKYILGILQAEYAKQQGGN